LNRTSTDWTLEPLLTASSGRYTRTFPGSSSSIGSAETTNVSPGRTTVRLLGWIVRAPSTTRLAVVKSHTRDENATERGMVDRPLYRKAPEPDRAGLFRGVMVTVGAAHTRSQRLTRESVG
jgi:hypothetical protein